MKELCVIVIPHSILLIECIVFSTFVHGDFEISKFAGHESRSMEEWGWHERNVLPLYGFKPPWQRNVDEGIKEDNVINLRRNIRLKFQ